jgi:hypothetical protein
VIAGGTAGTPGTTNLNDIVILSAAKDLLFGSVLRPSQKALGLKKKLL